MVEVSETMTISREREAVFPVSADPERQLEWDPATMKSVEKLTPGPLGRGSRYRGVFKLMGTVEYEFVEFEPPARFAHEANLKIGKARHGFELQSIPEGTRIVQSLVVEPRGVGRVLAPVMGLMLRKRAREINRRLKHHLESA